MVTIDLVGSVAGKPVIVLFLIGNRCGRQIKMVRNVKNPAEQKTKFVVEFPYEKRSYDEGRDDKILEVGLLGNVFLVEKKTICGLRTEVEGRVLVRLRRCRLHTHRLQSWWVSRVVQIVGRRPR